MVSSFSSFTVTVFKRSRRTPSETQTIAFARGYRSGDITGARTYWSNHFPACEGEFCSLITNLVLVLLRSLASIDMRFACFMNESSVRGGLCRR